MVEISNPDKPELKFFHFARDFVIKRLINPIVEGIRAIASGVVGNCVSEGCRRKKLI